MKQSSLGVVVARFQVAELHAGHHHLLRYVLDRHEQLLIVLGSTGGQPDHRNPLSHDIRAGMVRKSYPNSLVGEVFDHSSNEVWSKALDATIERYTQTGAVLYESRDGFGRHYQGRYTVVTIPPLPNTLSGADSRTGLQQLPITKEVRAGMILQEGRRLPISYQVTDIGLINHQTNELLMGQKLDETTWRLFGGFVDPTDESLEAAALRELKEEAGGTLLTHKLQYLGSSRIEDARYRDGRDALLSALFVTYYLGGNAKAGDDIAKIRWVSLTEALQIAHPNHRPLIERIVAYHNR